MVVRWSLIIGALTIVGCAGDSEYKSYSNGPASQEPQPYRPPPQSRPQPQQTDAGPQEPQQSSAPAQPAQSQPVPQTEQGPRRPALPHPASVYTQQQPAEQHAEPVHQAAAPPAAAAPAAAAPAADDADGTAVLQLVNEIRTKAGLQALVMDPPVSAVARAYAYEMMARNFFSHISPEGKDPNQRLQEGGINRGSTGENIAVGQTSAAQVVSEWMGSPSHADAIVNPKYTRMGLGRSGNYWVQLFTN